jgi:pimeloyl-ACP methyl ester carboxylesterase
VTDHTPQSPAVHPDDPDEWRHETGRINGIDMHYVTVDPDPEAVDHPTGAAPLVVLLHGFPEYWYAWRHQLTPLAEAGYRVVAPDLRGYNRSSQPEGVDSYRMAELVGDVRGLIEHWKAPDATVVGHDWGGMIGWELAIREPELVRQLVICNAPHPGLFQETLLRSPEQLLRSSYAGAFQLPGLFHLLAELLTLCRVQPVLRGTTAPSSVHPAHIVAVHRGVFAPITVSGGGRAPFL